MHWETLPNWFQIIYYLFLLITFATTILSVVQKKMISMSVVAILLVATVPIISLFNSIGRVEGMNEMEHLVSQFQQGAIWSVFTILGYLFLFVWWFLFILKSMNKNQSKVSK
ncbi:hypothetical protein [Niallia sp. 03133]|uniref:hypothetical protein n=1 Tax=Niallia sp. 03133 TaxID=3458060 RepID=UPI004044F85A